MADDPEQKSQHPRTTIGPKGRRTITAVSDYNQIDWSLTHRNAAANVAECGADGLLIGRICRSLSSL
jgi:hypothetical protein